MPFKFNPFTHRLDIVDVTAIPPGVVVSLTPDQGGAVSPSAGGNINVPSASSTANFDAGIRTIGDPGTNTVTYTLTNRLTGTVTTTDATPTTIITQTLGAVPTSYSISGVVTALIPATGDSASYDFQACFKTTGAAATEVGTEYPTTFEDASLTTADITISATGNTVILQVIGVAATTIHWDAYLTYRQVI